MSVNTTWSRGPRRASRRKREKPGPAARRTAPCRPTRSPQALACQSGAGTTTSVEVVMVAERRPRRVAHSVTEAMPAWNAIPSEHPPAARLAELLSSPRGPFPRGCTPRGSRRESSRRHCFSRCWRCRPCQPRTLRRGSRAHHFPGPRCDRRNRPSRDRRR
jgi:hypothetical protein